MTQYRVAGSCSSLYSDGFHVAASATCRHERRFAVDFTLRRDFRKFYDDELSLITTRDIASAYVRSLDVLMRFQQRFRRSTQPAIFRRDMG